IGKVGLMLGWDLAFPEVSRAMTLDGAELLCVMANWETNSMDEWKTYVRARAYENALFVAAANRVGSDVTMRFGGESMIVGPRGRVYASLENEPDVKKAPDAPKTVATTTAATKEPAPAASATSSEAAKTTASAAPATTPAPRTDGEAP